jgi:photosystem II stability/assembly factor-like uncharacterized protein
MAQKVGGDIVLYTKRGVGPGYEFQYEGCAEHDDTDLGPGAFTAITCKSNAAFRKTVTIDVVEGEEGLKTSTIRVLWDQAQWLMTQSKACNMTVDFRLGECGRPDNPDDWASILRLYNARVQPATVNTGAGVTDKVMVGANVAASAYDAIYTLTLDQSDVGSVAGLDAVLAIGDAECSGDCGPGFDSCDYVFVATEGEYLDTAAVYYTDDGGSTWTAFAVSPFAVGESISCMVGRVSGSGTGTTMRLIVFRGTTDGANPAECAITTDWGATWTAVDIGAVNGQYVLSAVMRGRKIWCGTDDGYIYYSADDGATWAAQSAGVTVTNPVNSIAAYSDSILMAVCDSDEGLVTTDGATWSAIGDVAIGDPDINAVSWVTQWIAYIGTSTGYVYYTTDRGTTWSVLQNIGSEVLDLKMWSDTIGYLLAKDGADVWRTVDGVTFVQDTSTPAAAILRQLSICSANELWAVGQTSTDADMAVHGQPQPATPIF